MCICHLKCFCSSSVFMSLFLSLSVHYYVNYILIFIVMWVRYPIRGCEKDSRFLGLVIERGHIYIQSRHSHGEYTESIQSTSSHVHSKLIALLHNLTVSINNSPNPQFFHFMLHRTVGFTIPFLFSSKKRVRAGKRRSFPIFIVLAILCNPLQAPEFLRNFLTEKCWDCATSTVVHPMGR